MVSTIYGLVVCFLNDNAFREVVMSKRISIDAHDFNEFLEGVLADYTAAIQFIAFHDPLSDLDKTLCHNRHNIEKLRTKVNGINNLRREDLGYNE